MKNMIVYVLGIVVAVIIISAATLPLLFTPTTSQTATTTNSTTVGADEAGGIMGFDLPSTFLDDSNSSVVVTFARSGEDTLVARSPAPDGDEIATLTGDSPQTFYYTSFADGINRLNFTSNGTGTNVTDITVTYANDPQSTTQSWNSSLITIYNVLLGIAIIGAVIVMIL